MNSFSKIESFKGIPGRLVKFYIAFMGVIFIVLPGGCNTAADSSDIFLHQVIDPHPNTGKECCTDILILGDINGDGCLDVVVGAEKAEEQGLVWYQYPTWEKHPVASGEFTTDGQTADIDGDGDLDIVIGIYPSGGGEILWFENTTGTGQGEWIRHRIGKGYAHDLIVGDLDGDDDLEIVTCDKKKVVAWKQVSLKSWKEHIIIERKGEGIALADIDGDADLDIVYGGSWLQNPGSLKKTPWTVHFIAPKWSPDTRVVVTDMNRDLKPDVILSASEGKGALSWFQSPENPTSGSWIEHPVEKGMLEGAHSLQVADLDNDGDLDIVTAEMHTSPQI